MVKFVNPLEYLVKMLLLCFNVNDPVAPHSEGVSLALKALKALKYSLLSIFHGKKIFYLLIEKS